MRFKRAAIAAGVLVATVGAAVSFGPAAANAEDFSVSTPASPTSSLVIRTTPQPGTVSTQASSSMADGNHAVSSSSSGNHIKNSFRSTVKIANAGTFAKVLSGKTTTSWTGSGSGTVSLTDHFWATGVGISISVPAGASGSIFNQGVDYKATGKGTSTTNNYQGVEWAGPLLSVNQNTTSTWKVGNNTYSLTTN